jgi:hypothetical protein
MAEAILKVIATGAPYMICCSAVGLAYDSFMTWKREDSDFAARVEEASGKAALRLLAKIEKQADQNFAAASWILERRFPEIFARPEVQLNLIQQNNVTENHLSITISSQEVREIEAQSEPVRQKVSDMFAAYRPGALGNGNGNGARTGELQSEPVEKQPEELAPITTKKDQPEFWFQFASGSGERAVSKEVAIYVASTIVNETVGRGLGQQAIVAFKQEEPITVADVLAVIERLCGGPSGWQHLQKKARIA